MQDIFLDELLRVDADHLAAVVKQRPAAVSRIDRRVRLNPRAGTRVGKYSDRADDTFRHAEKHGVAGITDRQHIFALFYSCGVRKREMRKVLSLNLDERDIEIGIEVHYFGFKLLASRQKRLKRFFTAREVRVRGDDARIGYKKSCSRVVQPFQ